MREELGGFKEVAPAVETVSPIPTHLFFSDEKKIIEN